jgi:methyl-accepting chemotaxis protein
MKYRTMKFKRRNTFLINRDLQFTLLFSSLFYVVLFLTVVGAALFIPLFIKLRTPGGSSWEVQQGASEIILYIHAHFWPAALFSLVLIGLLSLRSSHRIAGPIYKIALVLQSLKNGILPKAVYVRKGDRLAAEVSVADQMLDSLRMQVREIQSAQADLNDAIVACEKVIGHASTEGIIERMHDVREKTTRLANRVSYFKVEG